MLRKVLALSRTRLARAVISLAVFATTGSLVYGTIATDAVHAGNANASHSVYLPIVAPDAAAFSAPLVSTPLPTVASPTPTVSSPTPKVSTPTSTASSPTPKVSTPTATDPPAATPTPVPTSGVNALTLGTLNALTTFNTIALEVQFSGDDSEQTTVQLQFKKQTDTTWRNGLPYGMWGVWKPSDGGPRAFYQSVVNLDPGTAYDLQATFTNPFGAQIGTCMSCTQLDQNDVQVNWSVTTDVDNIAPPSALTPTFFLDAANGNDAAGCGTQAAPCKTLSYAQPLIGQGAVVSLAPGHYVSTGKKWTGAGLTFLGQVAPIQFTATVISGETWQVASPANVGSHAIIESGIYTSPSGSGDQNAGVWVKNDGQGSDPPCLSDSETNQTWCNIWSWKAPVANLGQMGYATDRTTPPQRIANWKSYSSGTLSTAVSFAGQVNAGDNARSGFWVAVTGNNFDPYTIYLRMPQDLNPNSYYVTLGGGPNLPTGLELAGTGQRVSQVEIRTFNADVQVDSTASGAIIDHNDLEMAFHQVYSTGDKSNTFSSGLVVQDNLMADSNLWLQADHDVSDAGLANTAVGIGIPWGFVKGQLTYQGTDLGVQHVGQNNETNGVYLTGGAWRATIRDNTMDGPFNGVTEYNSGYSRYADWLTDVHDNVMRHISDDALEPEESTISFQMWHNRMEYTRSTLSVGPAAYGPLVYWKNQGWETGILGVPPTLQSSAWDGGGGEFIKWGGGPNPPSVVYYIANTMWSDEAPQVAAAGCTTADDTCATDGGGNYAGGGGTPEAFYFRDNYFRSSRYAMQEPIAGPFGNGNLDSEDYDQFATDETSRPDNSPSPPRGIGWGATNYPYLAKYRAGSGQGAHTNPAWGGVEGGTGDVQDYRGADAALVHAETIGDLRAGTGSYLIGAGTSIPNILDRPGVDFAGTSPNIGADQATQ